LAGITEECSIDDLTPAQLKDNIDSRNMSARNLDHATRTLCLNLEHFVMFSSSKSMWGPPGLAAFCASSSSFDALAKQRRVDGLPALSLKCGWLRGAGFLEDASRSGSMEPEYTNWSTLHIKEFLSILHKLIAQTDLPAVIAVSNEVSQPAIYIILI
jgi:hypothetical protein